MNACRRGHVYTAETLYLDSKGKRCRICRALVTARYYQRHRLRILAKKSGRMTT